MMAEKKKTTPKKRAARNQSNPGGRPSKLTDEVSNNLCRLIQKGMSYQHACDGTGIGYATFQSWKRKAQNANYTKPPSKYKKEETKFVKYLSDIKVAESRGIEKNLDRILVAADVGAWQAGAWILERRHPDTYAKLEKIDQKTEHSGGVAIQLNMKDCSKKEE